MRHTDPDDAMRLPDDAAHRLLARAAELDAERPSEVSVARLRVSALEAGIGAVAFDAALAEARAVAVVSSVTCGLPGDGDHPQRSAVSSVPAVPGWVRLCMLGVPDRRAAKAFYWLFAFALCAVPVLLHGWWPMRGISFVLTDVALSAFPVFALWSTSRAIRWLDSHGWELLR